MKILASTEIAAVQLDVLTSVYRSPYVDSAVYFWTEKGYNATPSKPFTSVLAVCVFGVNDSLPPGFAAESTIFRWTHLLGAGRDS